MITTSTGLLKAFNRTRNAWLADRVRVADSHWSRFVGLMATRAEDFRMGAALWIKPCHGVHTFFMSFPIDVLYLAGDGRVIHVEREMRPWRLAPVKLRAQSVLELPPATAVVRRVEPGDVIEIA